MYSSVFSFFQVLTVLFPAWGFLCVSVHCVGGDTASFDEGRKDRGVDTK